MITTVTLNPAWDITYRLEHFEVGASNRVAEVSERPGGKGVNVSRVLTSLGIPNIATGLATPDFEAALNESGVSARFVHAVSSVRRTVVVHDGRTTALLEPGQPPRQGAADSLVGLIADFGTDVLAVCGSSPPQIDTGFIRRLVHVFDGPLVVDTSGVALAEALDTRAVVVKANRDEFCEVAFSEPAPGQIARNIRRFCRAGSPMIVVTMGEDGILAGTADRVVLATPPVALKGNPTGAGDAATAALCRGLFDEIDLSSLAIDMAALSAAAVVTPTAGIVDHDMYSRLLPQIRWRELT